MHTHPIAPKIPSTKYPLSVKGCPEWRFDTLEANFEINMINDAIESQLFELVDGKSFFWKLRTIFTKRHKEYQMRGVVKVHCPSKVSIGIRK